MGHAQGHITVRRRPKDGLDGLNGKDGKDGAQGPQGIAGCMYRYTVWESGREYRNDSALTSGTRIIDVVTTMAVSVGQTSSIRVYMCKTTHTSAAATKPASGTSWQTYWTQMNSLAPTVTPLLLTQKLAAEYIDVKSIAADSGFIENLYVKHLKGADGDFSGTITATKGKIGGFDIGESYIGLTGTSTGSPTKTGMSLYDTFICFSDTDYDGANYWAFIGSNVMPAGTYRATARFEARATDQLNASLGSAIGVYSSVKGFKDSYAFYCPEGVFAGFRLPYKIQNTGATLTDMDAVIECCNSAACSFYLPTTPKHGQLYAIIHTSKTTMTVRGSTAHPILRVTNGSTGTAVSTTAESGSMEVVLMIYNAQGVTTLNGASKTGYWALSYMKV